MSKISIIVPAYNESTRINKCIESLLNQSYKDIEIIVVDDGSTDDTLEVLNRYDDKRLKIFSQANKGQGAARNYGLSKAEGKYLTFVDADDYIDGQMIEKLLDNLKKDKSDIAVCDLYKQYGDKNILFKNLEQFTDDNVTNLMLSHPGPVGRLYNRELFLDNNIKFVEGYVNEDLGTIPLLGIYSEKISYLEEPLYYYVIHDNSTTRQKTYSKKLEDIFYVVEYLKQEFKDRSGNKYNDIIEYLYIEHLLYSASLKFIDFKEGLNQIKKINSIIKQNFLNWKTNPYFTKKSLKFRIVCNLVFNRHFIMVKLLKIIKR